MKTCRGCGLPIMTGTYCRECWVGHGREDTIRALARAVKNCIAPDGQALGPGPLVVIRALADELAQDYQSDPSVAQG